MAETYLRDKPDILKNLEPVDYTINGIFITEFLIKSISLGFFMDHNSYLRDSWCQLDFVIVFFSIIEMSLTGSDL